MVENVACMRIQKLETTLFRQRMGVGEEHLTTNARQLYPLSHPNTADNIIEIRGAGVRPKSKEKSREEYLLSNSNVTSSSVFSSGFGFSFNNWE